MLVKTKLLAAAGMMTAAAFSTPATAQNLVQNGGFETGSFSSWSGTATMLGSNYAGVDNGDPFTSYPTPHSGTYEAYLGSIGTTSALNQTVATMAGQSYVLSFYLLNDTAASTGYTNSFAASFGAQSLLSASAVPVTAYQRYSYNVVASSASTLLSFTSRNDGGYFELDDVSLVASAATPAVPEAATWAMMMAGLGVVGGTLRRRQKASMRVSFA